MTTQNLFKKTLAFLLTGAMAVGMTACGGEDSGKDDGKLTVGIVQMADNGAFTDMREGFLDRLTELGYTDDKLEINYKNEPELELPGNGGFRCGFSSGHRYSGRTSNGQHGE